MDPALLLPSNGRKMAADTSALIQASFLLLSNWISQQSLPYLLLEDVPTSDVNEHWQAQHMALTRQAVAVFQFLQDEMRQQPRRWWVMPTC